MTWEDGVPTGRDTFVLEVEESKRTFEDLRLLGLVNDGKRCGSPPSTRDVNRNQMKEQRKKRKSGDVAVVKRFSLNEKTLWITIKTKGLSWD